MLNLRRDFLAGIFFVAIGLGFFVVSRTYNLGSASRMGPGYFPMLLGGVLMVIGALVSLKSLRQTSDAGESVPVAVKSAAIIIGSTLLFALALTYAGLVIAVIVLVVAASAAVGRQFKWQTFALAAGLAAFSALLFVTLLGLPVPLWPNI
ncbi:MAG: hypothetical protein JWL93_531 [Hyphomicrobiales bacterium]|nr:hypothetical protein [Hyphomicrobiales bacterium]